jgi:ferredoxin
MPRLTLRVDPIACDGRGLCAEVLPELIRMDDWGFPVIANGIVPARLRPAAAEAVRICPKLALRLEPVLEPDPGPRRFPALRRHAGSRPITRL